MTPERIIGNENRIPWYLPEDLKNFQRLTLNNTVIIGRKTYDSLPEKYRPLLKRNNVVVSRNMVEKEGILVCRSLEEAIEKAKSFEKEIFIIGGSSIYQQAIPIADRMYLTRVKNNYPGDSYFPKFEENDWIIEENIDYPLFSFMTLRKK